MHKNYYVQCTLGSATISSANIGAVPSCQTLQMIMIK